MLYARVKCATRVLSSIYILVVIYIQCCRLEDQSNYTRFQFLEDKAHSSSTRRKKQSSSSTSTIYHGRVLNEFCRRVLSRSVAQSNVLVVAPEGPTSKVVRWHASSEGHDSHFLPTDTDLSQWLTNSNIQANWFLLSYFVGDAINSIDTMLSPSRFSELSKGATLTYIVFGVQASLDSMSGLTAVQTLLDEKYKLQLLSSSHLDGDQPYRPNYLFQSTSDVERFLSTGSNYAGKEFRALLFATQGLDLAIPSRLSYLTLENLDLCENYTKTSGRCDAKLVPWAQDQNVFMKCPLHHQRASIEFDDKVSELGVRVKLDNETIVDRSRMELWLGHQDPIKAEVACARMTKALGADEKQPVACTTRVLKQSLVPNPKSNEKKLNFLSILMDPISRSQFHRSLPKTKGALEQLGFVNFPKYTVVGDNSGPNQAALFTGHPLVGGRDGISSSYSLGAGKQWLWDVFNANDYATLKAEDICVQNSNMVQSMKPKTHHGDQLYKMFCFDFDRPNCLGKDMAAGLLTNYTRQFMNAYENDGENWAGMISFVDSHEDTVTLISYLDEMLVEFLHTIDLEKTVVVFSSDHGLHYGPSFQSNGERERAEPILYLHSPRTMDAFRRNSEFWVTPFDVHETILDATSLQMTDSRDTIVGTSLLRPLGSDHSQCETTPGIPERFCKILNPRVTKPKQCTYITEPPSIFSFYSDISREHRPKWPKCKKEEANLPLQGEEECLCATSRSKIAQYWVPCNSSELEQIDSALKEKGDPLRMRRCRAKTSLEYRLEINITVTPKSRVLQRSRAATHYSVPSEAEALPNILFLEIDSLSQSASLRHLPKITALLESHSIVENSKNGFDCPTGFCAAKFKKTSIVGQNSIPNQLAALSGCIDRKLPGVDSYMRKKIHENTPLEAWCPSGELENPFMFNFLPRLGYTTFFGEEFCYTKSPWVIQDNIFRLNPDYQMNELFCQVAQAQKEKNHDDPNKRLYLVEHDTSQKPNPCVDGRSRQELAFEYIRGMWDAYPETPKFAYLNSLAAHDYSVDLARLPLGVEAYDEHLSSFLEEIMSHPQANNTIIVLRSDHGLQGGASPIDFSTQVEHLHPWNNLIIPAHFRGSSWIRNIYFNQDRLVTGFDLYNTLRALAVPHEKGGGDPMEIKFEGYRDGIPDWSYDLLSNIVPSNRSCEDAKIPPEFCPCSEERKDLMPYFYVGHAEKGIERE